MLYKISFNISICCDLVKSSWFVIVLVSLSHKKKLLTAAIFRGSQDPLNKIIAHHIPAGVKCNISSPAPSNIKLFANTL